MTDACRHFVKGLLSRYHVCYFQKLKDDDDDDDDDDVKLSEKKKRQNILWFGLPAKIHSTSSSL